MPRNLVTEKDLRKATRLPFCYLCGLELSSDFEENNRDHVPPKTCFQVKHRSSPLILPTHKTCNGARKVSDEMIGQYLSPFTRKAIRPENRKLQASIIGETEGNHLLEAFMSVNISDEVWRWLGAFHSTLYQEPWPQETQCGIQLPMPIAVPGPTGPTPDRFRGMHFGFVSKIKQNRAAHNVDRLVCNNGAVRYECVWFQPALAQTWHCVFALDFCGWGRLGRALCYPAHGCTGHYMLPSGMPPTLATRALELTVSTPNLEPSDPFGF